MKYNDWRLICGFLIFCQWSYLTVVRPPNWDFPGHLTSTNHYQFLHKKQLLSSSLTTSSIITNIMIIITIVIIIMTIHHHHHHHQHHHHHCHHPTKVMISAQLLCLTDKWPLDSVSKINNHCHGETLPHPRTDSMTPGLQIWCYFYNIFFNRLLELYLRTFFRKSLSIQGK